MRSARASTSPDAAGRRCRWAVFHRPVAVCFVRAARAAHRRASGGGPRCRGTPAQLDRYLLLVPAACGVVSAEAVGRRRRCRGPGRRPPGIYTLLRDHHRFVRTVAMVAVTSWTATSAGSCSGRIRRCGAGDRVDRGAAIGASRRTWAADRRGLGRNRAWSGTSSVAVVDAEARMLDDARRGSRRRPVV